MNKADGGAPAWMGNRWRLAFLAGAGVFAVWFGFLRFDVNAAATLVRHWGYYVLSATVVLWLVYLALVVRRNGRLASVERGWRRAGLVALGLTLVAATTTPYGYKILFDETVLQSTAYNLATDRAVGAIGKAYELSGQLYVQADYLDKRPYLYPYLVALAHQLTGAREANAFILNTVLMPIMLLLAYGCGRGLAGDRAGLVAMISLGAFSLVALNATGAGMEMLNLTLVLAVVYCGGRYLEAPGAERLGLFVLTAVLLANTRYESSIYVATTGLVVLEGWRRAGRVIVPLALIVAPLALIPYALHNVYLSGTPALWELREGQEHRFSIGYFSDNAISAWRYFFSVDGNMANSPWLSWVGVAAFFGLAWRALRHRRHWSESGAMEWSVTAVSLGVVVNFGLLLAYYWGNLNDPIVTRLSLPLHAMLALLIGVAIARLAERDRRVVPGAITLCLCSYLWWGIPMNRKIPEFNLIETTQRWELATVEARGPAARLIVTEKSPLFWFANGVSSTSTQRLRQRMPELLYHWERKSFDEIIVMQRLSATNMAGDYEIEEESRLPDQIELELIEERRIGIKRQRISRVIGVGAGAGDSRASTGADVEDAR